MPRRLSVINGADQGQVFLLPAAGTLLIGNSRKHTDICLHDLYVARVHCEVEVVEDRITVSNKESSIGILVNGAKVSQQDLHLGDVLRVGNSHLRLEDADAPLPEEADSPETASPRVSEKAGPIPTLAQERLGDLSGRTLGHFELGEMLGTGHYGVVFRAQDLKADQAVALKVLSPVYPADAEEMRTFVAALKPVLVLHHPNLVLLRGLGKTGPYVWLARELFAGDSLPAQIQRQAAARKMKWRLALRVGVHLARALEFISRRHLVHANITPANVLLPDEEGPARLNDLGLWDALGGSVLQQQQLKRKVEAELPYLSPEHIDPQAPVDELSDQYGVGAVMYVLLTGRPPCQGSSQKDTMALIRDTMPVRPKDYYRSIPDELQSVVLRMLSKHPEERYPSPGELLADLTKIASEREVPL